MVGLVPKIGEAQIPALIEGNSQGLPLSDAIDGRPAS
jgi:hypothetical protein